jgi:hypothetical protein
MTADSARLAWGFLAGVSAVCSLVGFVASLQALRVALGRRAMGGPLARLATTRDLWMLGALALSSALGLITAGVLIGLLGRYGPELEAVLARLAVPVLGAYLGYAAQTALVGTVAPVWLLARWRALDKAHERRGGID